MLGGLCLCAFGAQAQIALRASTSAAVPAPLTITYVSQGGAASRAGCGSITPTLPGGNPGDLLVAVVAAHAQPTVTMAGWNPLFFASDPSNVAAGLFWRIATGGDPTTVDQSGTCNTLIAQIARFRGVDTANPFETAPLPSTNASVQNAASVTSGTQAVPYAGAMLVFTAHSADNDNNMGPLPGFTRAFDSATGAGANAAIALYRSSPTTTPPYTAGPYAVTKNRGADPNYGVVFALRPANSRLVIGVPPGTALNDVMIATVTVRPCSSTSGGACTTTVTAPIGWTAVGTVDQTTGGGTGGYGNRLFVYQRVATASEPASYTWDMDGTPIHAGAAGSILSFSGVDTTSPIVANAGQATPSAFTHTAPSVDTTGVPNAMLVTAHADNSSATWTPPTGMTEQADIASLAAPNALGLSLEMNMEALTVAGPTGTRTATQSNPPTADTGATESLALRPAINLAHYAITVVSSTVANCDYAQITISGHDTTHNLVAPPAGRSLAISTSTGTGVWQGPGTVAGTGAWTPSGANNGAATYLWPGGETSFTVTLRESAVTSLSINLNDGSVFEDPLEDPTISFVNSAFRISNGANASAAVGTQIAGKPSNTGFGAQTLYLQAVRTDTQTGACTSLFPSGSDVSVQVGAQCNNPASCTQSLTLTSSAASSNTATFIPSGAYAGSMNFNFSTANAEAPFTLDYADAGQITLQFQAPMPSPPANQYVQGTSNAFVVRPFGFAFSGASHGTNATAPVLAAAGDNFAMTVGAYRWASGQDANNDGVPDAGVNLTGNGLTPNFAASTTLSATANLPGVATGTLSRASGAATILAAEWAGGTAPITDWRYSEAGNVFLTASSTSYLGVAGADVSGDGGLDGTGAAGGYIGRFRPKQFAVSAASLTDRSDLACPAGFTYMDEPLKLAFTLTAQNAQGNTTQNYTGSYAKLDPTVFANWSLGARSGTSNLTSRVDSGVAPSGSWTNGVANVTMTTGILRATPDNPDGPYTVLQFGIAPTDSDGTAMASLDFDADNNGINERKNLGVSTEVRFGRLLMQNALGPEASVLPIPISVQYWNGSAFATNTLDSCTSLASSDIALDFSPPTNLTACKTRVSAGTVSFASGVGSLTLTAPGAGNSGTVLLTANLTSAAGSYCNAGGSYVAATGAGKPYLLGRWNDAADPDSNPNTFYDDNASARAAFGLYGSQPNNFIYQRENY